MGNPFQPTMVKMKFPEGSGGSISFNQFVLQADESGCVEVPADIVGYAEAHGLTVYEEPQPKGKK